MEVLNPVGGDTYRLPVGYRFDPTDEILAGYYLRKRIMAHPLPNDLIQDYDVHQTEPWELPGGGKCMNWQRFFFYDVRSRVLGNPEKRDAGKGQWEMVEKDEEVGFSDEQVIAKKSVLVFWKAKGSSLAKTKWVMHEFRLALKSNPSKMSALAVCRIFERKNSKRAKKARVCEGVKSDRSNIEEAKDVTATVIDFTVECSTETGPPPPPPPGTP
ncbi:hypothetical protein LR48_Vigan03g175000 [Vigna angularis]|uniref:NAC domain-containing protein n=2 Tax=Phaseolus angularis TaxID=3914 RepID=A0A0L9U6B5_PHAAN|nr:NAC domain-containing protein 83 [Vigna angularis]KAG2405198.1 uncharacterized protein HKW66_Vig0044530 [Vigna angularis]KOM38368.1 hypothetical protein LR48_Vigan03g175000 [Vigna angularis]BAT84762.1 hypothetical protein VIGAN_04221300 [Vigna angularis var. angularis]